MALSKASKSPVLFALKGSGVNELAGSNAFVTSVSREWKMLEFLFYRSTTNPVDITLSVYSPVNGSFTVKEVAGVTTNYVRVVANLADGDYVFCEDVELLVTTSGLGALETWKVRVTGQVLA